MKHRGQWIGGAVTAVLGGLAAWGILAGRHLSELTDPAERYRAWCDAFTVPGVIILMFALLTFVAGEGTLNGVTWILKRAVRMLIPGKGLKQQSYREYLAERSERKKDGRPYLFLYVVGGAFLLVGIIFLILFYR